MFSCIEEQPAITKEKFKEVCLSFGKQILELASKNAEIEVLGYNDYKVDNDSILDTIKQVEI